MLRAFLCLGVFLPIPSGCASIAGSIADSTIDAIKCHNECPGGPGEKACIEKCRERRSAARARAERQKEDAKFWPKRSWEWRPPYNPVDPRPRPSDDLMK